MLANSVNTLVNFANNYFWIIKLLLVFIILKKGFNFMLLPSQHISESHQALLFEQSQSLRGEVIEFGRGNKLNVVIAKGDAKNDKVLIIFNAYRIYP